MYRKHSPQSTSASGAYCTRKAVANRARKAASQAARQPRRAPPSSLAPEGRRMHSASRDRSSAAATIPVSGLWAKPTSSYQKAPASSAARAAASPRCRRAKKYMPAGMAKESPQNASLTPPTYQNGWPRPSASNAFSRPAISPGSSHRRAP